MTWDDFLDALTERPRMWLLRDDFFDYCSALTGFAAREGAGDIEGYSDWMGARRKDFKNVVGFVLAYAESAQQEGAPHVPEQPSADEEKEAIAHLLKTFRAYLQSRNDATVSEEWQQSS